MLDDYTAAAGQLGPELLTPGQLWSGLDHCWQEAFRQAWEALRTGNIAVGACAATPDGTMVHAARNRVADNGGPPGEIFGSSLAHAETNVLARLPFEATTLVTVTSTLEPCIQCSAALRLGPVAEVRFAGADPLWEGCHDFSPLSRREATRGGKFSLTGPRDDEIGLFGTLISRFGLGLKDRVETQLRELGEADILDLAHDLEASGAVRRLAAVDVREAFGELWPQLTDLRAQRSARLADAQ